MMTTRKGGSKNNIASQQRIHIAGQCGAVVSQLDFEKSFYPVSYFILAPFLDLILNSREFDGRAFNAAGMTNRDTSTTGRGGLLRGLASLSS